MSGSRTYVETSGKRACREFNVGEENEYDESTQE